MPENSATSQQKLKVGIECESIEEDSYGIARLINKLLQEIARRPELEQEFTFYLYFKKRIPDYPYLNAPIFRKRVLGVPSFSLYYYVFLPIRQWFDGLDVMYYTNYMLPILHLGTSLVFSAHDVYYEARSRDIPLRYRIAYRIFCTWAAWRATKLIAMSEFGKRELQKAANVRADRIITNHLGIDDSREDIPAHPGEYILFVGQAFPRRHLRETLLAFEQIAPEFPELKFIAVGPDKHKPLMIKNLIRQIHQRLGDERVLYHERVSDDELAGLYKGARTVAYISSREAFGLPPLEGLAYGSVPVVADNALGHELFGEKAFFVPDPDSIESIADTLRESLTNTEKRADIQAAAPNIRGHFSWKAHTTRFLAIVRTLAC